MKTFSSLLLFLVVHLANFLPGYAIAGAPPIAERNPFPADGVVVFNELMYHPIPDDPALEWIELHNQMSVDVDLSNWSIQGGIQFRFPPGTVLLSKGYLVVAADPGRFSTNSGITGAFGPWSGKLANSGDTLELRNHNQRLMDKIAYTDLPPWPIGADGSGASLSKTRRLTTSGPAANWRASREVGGTPGRVNFPGLEGDAPQVDSLVQRDTPSRVLIPTSDLASPFWSTTGVDESTWTSSTASVGFDFGISGGKPHAPPRFFFPLDGDTLDGSGSGAAAIVSGATFSTNTPPGLGKTKSGDFAGVSQYIEIDDAKNPSEYTISLWVRFDTIRACSIVVRTDSGGPQGAWSHQIRLASSGKLEHYIFDGNAQTIVGTNVLVKGRWYHVAATARSGGSMKLFLNGVQEGVTRPVGNFWAGGNQWRLGSNSGDNRGFLDGQLSDVAYWDEEFSGPEIVSLAGGASPLLLNGLRSLYDTDLENIMHGRQSVAWLRTPFNIPPAASYDSLTLDVQYADGFVAWLNGTEIARRNAPLAIDWKSVATTNRSPLESIQVTHLDLSAQLGLLRPGSNLLAVQAMNSSPDDTNFLFSAQLRAREVLSAPDRIPVTFHELSPGSPGFWLELFNSSNDPLDLSGFRIAFSRGTFSTLSQATIPGGGFLVIKGEDLGIVPALRERLWLLSPGGTELLDSCQVLDRPQARRESDPRGEWLWPESLTPGAANTFEAHSEIVINEIFYHHPPTFPSAKKAAVLTNTVVLPFDAIWKYDNTGNEQPPAWFTASFDDSAWLQGPAPLGTATGTLPIPIRTAVPGNGKTTFYFRTTFQANQLPDQYHLFLTSMLDDGAIFYLNGTEVLRRNLTNGLVTSTTRALTNISQIAISAPVELFGTRLLPGLNTLAVEVHQALTNSTADFVLATRLHLGEEILPATAGEDYEENPEEWVELYNRSNQTVSLSGWQLSDAIQFTFPPGATLEPDGYLVVAKDAVSLRLKHPGVRIVGDYAGHLSHKSDRIRLLDPHANPVNEVRYFDDKPWPAAAGGGGSSLELRDPRSDNSVPEAWAASDESPAAAWRHYSVRATAINPTYSPALAGFNELRINLLDSGEALIDNVSVVEDPGFDPKELIQNGTFTTGFTKWRKTGTHIHTRVESDPDHSDNSVMHLIATGAGSYLNNLVETTLKNGTAAAPVVAGREYQISFDAKWVSGTPLLRTELYYNRVAATTRLELPARHGTPGRRNSRYEPNSGPTYRDLSVTPAVPKFREPIEVTVSASDPDGIQTVNLQYAVAGKSWQSIPMTTLDGTQFRATIPGQTNTALLQFYVTGVDSRSATSFYPAGGTNSRAFVKIDNAPPQPKVPLIRVLMDPKEALGFMPFTNLLSDDGIECTLVLNDRETLYGGNIRLHGSMWSRQTQESCGFNVQFPADHPYKGVRNSFILRRRDFGEILCRHMLVNSPDVPAAYDEFVHLLSPLPGNEGLARIILGNDDDVLLRSQFNGATPQVFKMEGIREFQATDTGGSEGYKLAVPIGWIQEYDLRDQGDDKEQYRWTTLISNHRDQDDYSRFIAMSKVFGMTGTNLQQSVPGVMDVAEWSRIFGLQALCGVADVYTIENPHNLAYLVRPEDGKVLALQNDWSFYFNLPTSQPLIGVQNLSKIFSLPVYRRVYYGQILRLMETTFNKAYMTRWVQHYGNVTGENYQSVLDYIVQRSASARAQFPKAVPFSISSNNGQDFQTNATLISVQGRGWIDVARIQLNQSPEPLDVQWVDIDRWQTVIALAPGTNDFVFTAYNGGGAALTNVAWRVINESTVQPQRGTLRISEIMYHPGKPDGSEKAAGFTDADDFEFVEIINNSSVPVSLKGVKFTLGIVFSFDGGIVPQLNPGESVVVVRKLAAFRARYGDSVLVAGVYSGGLANGGETLRLVDANNAVIEEVVYGTGDDSWPASAAGGGASLERTDFNLPASNPAAWRASTQPGGSPGSETVPFPQLQFSSLPDGQLLLQVGVPAKYQVLLESRFQLDQGEWQLERAFSASSAPRVETLSQKVELEVGTRYYRLRIP